MSYTPETLVACPNLQDKLNTIFTTQVAQFYRTPVPLTEYLMSGPNRNGIQQMVSRDAKIKTVELTYQPRILESEVESDVSLSSLCTATTERGNTSVTYTVDETSNLFLPQKFNVDSLARACESNENFFAEQIMRLVAAMDAAVNKKNATQIVALKGGWESNVDDIPNVNVDGSDNLELPTENPSSTDPFPSSVMSLNMATSMSNFGPYATIGGLQWYHYNELIKSGCCTNSGLRIEDIQNRFGSIAMYDRHVAEALSGNEFSLVLANGAAQVLWYNRWAGLFGRADANQSYGMITSPMTGIDYDLVIKHDCGNIMVTLTATTKVVALPLDMYQTGDTLDGTNGIATLEVVNT